METASPRQTTKRRRTRYQCRALISSTDVRLFERVGPRVWTSERDGSITVRQIENGAIERRIPGNRTIETVVSMLYTARYKRVWAGCSSGTLRVFSAETCKLVKHMVKHRGGIPALCLWNNKVLSGSNDFTINMWDAATCQFLRQLCAHSAAVRCLQANLHTVFSGSDDGTIRLWQPSDTHPPMVCRGVLRHSENSGSVLALALFENVLWAAFEDKTIAVWNVTNNALVKTVERHRGRICSLLAVNDTIWSSSADKTVCVWDARAAVLLKSLGPADGITGAVAHLQFVSRREVCSIWSTIGTKTLAILTAESLVENTIEEAVPFIYDIPILPDNNEGESPEMNSGGGNVPSPVASDSDQQRDTLAPTVMAPLCISNAVSTSQAITCGNSTRSTLGPELLNLNNSPTADGCSPRAQTDWPALKVTLRTLLPEKYRLSEATAVARNSDAETPPFGTGSLLADPDTPVSAVRSLCLWNSELRELNELLEARTHELENYQAELQRKVTDLERRQSGSRSRKAAAEASVAARTGNEEPDTDYRPPTERRNGGAVARVPSLSLAMLHEGSDAYGDTDLDDFPEGSISSRSGSLPSEIAGDWTEVGCQTDQLEWIDCGTDPIFTEPLECPTHKVLEAQIASLQTQLAQSKSTQYSALQGILQTMNSPRDTECATPRTPSNETSTEAPEWNELLKNLSTQAYSDKVSLFQRLTESSAVMCRKVDDAFERLRKNTTTNCGDAGLSPDPVSARTKGESSAMELMQQQNAHLTQLLQDINTRVEIQKEKTDMQAGLVDSYTKQREAALSQLVECQQECNTLQLQCSQGREALEIVEQQYFELANRFRVFEAANHRQQEHVEELEQRVEDLVNTLREKEEEIALLRQRPPLSCRGMPPSDALGPLTIVEPVLSPPSGDGPSAKSPRFSAIPVPRPTAPDTRPFSQLVPTLDLRSCTNYGHDPKLSNLNKQLLDVMREKESLDEERRERDGCNVRRSRAPSLNDSETSSVASSVASACEEENSDVMHMSEMALLKELQQASHEKKRLTSRISKLEQQLAEKDLSHTESLQHLREELARSQAECALLKQSLQQTTDRIGAYELEIAKMSAAIEERESMTQSVQRENEEFQLLVRRYQAERQAAVDRLRSLGGSPGSFESESTVSLEDELRRLSEKIETGRYSLTPSEDKPAEEDTLSSKTEACCQTAPFAPLFESVGVQVENACTEEVFQNLLRVLDDQVDEVLWERRLREREAEKASAEMHSLRSARDELRSRWTARETALLRRVQAAERTAWQLSRHRPATDLQTSQPKAQWPNSYPQPPAARTLEHRSMFHPLANISSVGTTVTLSKYLRGTLGDTLGYFGGPDLLARQAMIFGNRRSTMPC
eukprot:TRINITY_DN1608_c0_g1_i4.p1 TRINITY_DN1608_c0_g1~~TRINITY_DN1608_c0_g1_i4.p1  ORF type:complete len:1371 (+),score=233.90 TRINITY_DN1608_c0_g1_i4:57-4169(+)